jgi:hypothetical protein
MVLVVFSLIVAKIEIFSINDKKMPFFEIEKLTSRNNNKKGDYGGDSDIYG